MIEWLTAALDPSRPHEIGLAATWHARLMALAWLVLFPAGILAARFFKIMPGQHWPEVLDNKTWWYAHLSAQYTGGAVVLAALVVIAAGIGLSAASTHAALGWSALALLAVQFAGGWLRGTKGGPSAPSADGSLAGDHYDMTLRRRVFERFHKSAGYLALVAAAAAIAAGLWQVNAPRWMAVVLSLHSVAVIGVAAVLQRRGMAVDTYQAIWGLDPALPGNRMKPIGIGIRRPRERKET